MSNIDKIENVISRLGEVGETGVAGPIAASLVWSFAMSLANIRASQDRLSRDDDTEFSRFSPADRQVRAERLERRAGQLKDVISWAAMHATAEYLPSGADIVQRALSTDAPPTDDSLVDTLIESMEISRERAVQAVALNAKTLADRRALQQRALEVHRNAIAAEIDKAIADNVLPGVEFSTQDAARIADRIATKCDQYMLQRESRAAATRRPRRIQALAAERSLLHDILIQTDALAEQFEHELDLQQEDIAQVA